MMKKILFLVVAAIIVSGVARAEKPFNINDIQDGDKFHSLKIFSAEDLKKENLVMDILSFRDLHKQVRFLEKVGTNPFFLNLPFINLEDKLAFAGVIKKYDEEAVKEHKRMLVSAKWKKVPVLNSLYTVDKDGQYLYLLTSYFYRGNNFCCLSTFAVSGKAEPADEKKEKKLFKLKYLEEDFKKERTEKLEIFRLKINREHWEYGQAQFKVSSKIKY